MKICNITQIPSKIPSKIMDAAVNVKKIVTNPFEHSGEEVDVFLRGNSEQPFSATTADEIKQQRAEQKRIAKENKAKQTRQRAIAVGLDPNNIDHNQLMKWERSKKLGVDPETTSYKELDYLESKNRLLSEANVLKIDLKSHDIYEQQEVNLNYLRDVIKDADEELCRKLNCLGLGLDKNTSWKKISKIHSNIETAENIMMSEKLAKFLESGDLKDLVNDGEPTVSLKSFKWKCDEIFDDIKEGKMPIEIIDKLLENPEKYKSEIKQLFKSEDN